MKRQLINSAALTAAATCITASVASAAPVAWTDWTSITTGGATGTLGSVIVTLTASPGTIDGPSQTECGTNYWTGSAYTNGTVSNGPTACEQVALIKPTPTRPGSITVTLSQPIDSLYMGMLSIGNASVPVTYDFSHEFTIDSEGLGFFGDDLTNGVLSAGVLGGGAITMREFHGVLRFSAPVSSLTFTTEREENWHAFTFGAAAVPEPGTLALLTAALIGAGVVTRRKQTV